jgi:hypothetical protein
MCAGPAFASDTLCTDNRPTQYPGTVSEIGKISAYAVVAFVTFLGAGVGVGAIVPATTDMEKYIGITLSTTSQCNM